MNNCTCISTARGERTKHGGGMVGNGITVDTILCLRINCSFICKKLLNKTRDWFYGYTPVKKIKNDQPSH